jgi:response regulator RpfG family c-di-GMP phosphodiesterase
VAKYSQLLAQLYGLDSQICEEFSTASTMHDLGKIAIPDSILLKPGKLDSQEWNIMKTHALIGHQILSGSNLPILQMASKIAHEHHERFDGQGYPLGLKGDEISIYARITSIADVFDALISDRVYKKAWEYTMVIDLLKEEKGKQFDPYLIDLFLDNIDEFMAIKYRYED